MRSCASCRERNSCVKLCAEVEARLPKDYTGKDPRMEFSIAPSDLESFAERHSYESWDLSVRSPGRKVPDLSILTAKERRALLLIAGGMSMRAAARRLNINLNALQCRVASARRRLGAGQFPLITEGGEGPSRKKIGGGR